MVPRKDNNYEGKSVRDNMIELRKDVDYLKLKLEEHCATSRFNITTIIAIGALALGTIAIVWRGYP